MVSLFLNLISVEASFQQWGLDFIVEINPNSSRPHKWILTRTDYFTKWIEAMPTRRATEAVIMDFLENNILARFGFPKRIWFSYCLQGNGLAESFNKSLVRIIKKLLEENKRAWNTKLKYFLWDDRINTNRAIGKSPFQLVYGDEVIFPASLGVLVMKLLQDQ